MLLQLFGAELRALARLAAVLRRERFPARVVLDLVGRGQQRLGCKHGSIEAQRDDHHIRIAVVDRGIGIPEAARDRVFDRFFRVDSGATSHIGGTGLGLSLVRDIVAAHGGAVGLESVEGQGSRFWFTLPAAGG